MFDHDTAYSIAEEIVSLVRDSCERIEIAGSLRRGKRKVNDIDIVTVPRYSETVQTLFGESLRYNLLDDALAKLCVDGTLTPEASGPKIKRFWKTVPSFGEAIPIDFYIATPETWWTLLLIRTGSREHNIKLAKRAMQLHFHLKADGSGLLSAGGTLLPMHSEEEIFATLGLEYLPPEKRD